MRTVKAAGRHIVYNPCTFAKIVLVLGVFLMVMALAWLVHAALGGMLLMLTLGVVFVAVFFQPDPWLGSVETLAPEVVWRIPTLERRAALTIDDVPLLDDPTHIEAILDVLRSTGVTATLFIMSGFVLDPAEGGMEPTARERCLRLLRRAVAEGHELGNHMMFDKPAFVMENKDFDAAFLHCDKLISEIHGPEAWKAKQKHWFRPASALWNKHILATATRHGYTTVISNCYPHDVSAATRQLNHYYLGQRVRPGAVILVHDRWHTPETLDKALPKVAARGIQLGTLSALQATADAEASARGGSSDKKKTK